MKETISITKCITIYTWTDIDAWAHHHHDNDDFLFYEKDEEKENKRFSFSKWLIIHHLIVDDE